jgi:hypothetical protein
MKLTLFIIALSFAFSNNLYSEVIYKSYDRNGNPVFSDREPKSKHQIIKTSSVKKRPVAKEEDEKTIPKVRLIESIRTTTNATQNDVNAIYEELYKSNNDIKGEVKIAFSIDAEGKVVSCSEDESDMSIASFNGSICETINALDYGEVEEEKATKVNWTFKFQPKEQ